MKFRRFNDRGLEEFRRQLLAIKADPAAHLSPPLLTDPTLTEPLDPQVEAVPVPFNNRMDFARWLYDASDRGSRIPRSDPGFWAWLTAALFDQVCPRSGNSCVVREIARYIPAFHDRQRHYRHALSGSYSIYYLHRDDPSIAMVFLFNKLHELNHFYYQIASRQDLVASKSVVSIATELYIDSNGRMKVGSTSHKKPGSVFRLVKLMNQLDRVWDIAQATPVGLIEKLPGEFAPYRDQNVTRR